MERLTHYLNPIARLGKRKYSIRFPLIASLAICILSEVFAILIVKNPAIVGVYIIWINTATIMYFAFRDGLKGGIIAAVIPIFYYGYIIYTRHMEGNQLISSVETTITLGLLFLLMATIIGWLKQTIDVLIGKEAAARRQSEEGKVRLQTILDQMPVGVLVADKDGGLLHGNKYMEYLLGRKTAKKLEIDDNRKSQYAYRADKPLLTKDFPIVRAFKYGRTVAPEEMEYLRDDKKRITLRVNATPIKNKQNKLIAAVSTFYDITQEKELEKRKDDFVNMASHELKTPITSLKLYIDSLTIRIGQYNDERAMKTVNSIKHQTERLQELVNDLLDVSRLQTGKLSFTKEDFRIDILVEETIEDLKGLANGQAIVYNGTAPVLVHADRFRIYQVITNLITNAVKYSENGKDIKVRIKREAGKVMVSVQDSGIGIEKEQQKKIFDRLYQVVDDKEKTFPGFGMGLYISKEIIKRHKGSIWVESEKRKGSTFFFTLPLKK
jgi:PAS domain S-box-containing protein